VSSVHKISAVVITFNEEKNIERCLKSLLAVVDEIILVDSGSTDQTQKLAQQLGAIVMQQNWLGYSAQKNKGNEWASHDWILSLDADECLSDALIKELIALKLNPQTAILNRLTNYCGTWIKYGSWFPDRKIRFFNRLNARWEGDIHEKVIFHEITKPIELRGLLLHYSYHNESEHWAQLEKFTALTAADAFAKGKKSSVLKQYLSPMWRFFRDYVVKLGFLDGSAGFKIARISAYGVFLKHQKIILATTKVS